LRPHTLIQRSERQVSCPLREEAAILNMATGMYYGLDAVAAMIWQKIERPASFADVNAAILSEYDVPPALAEQDLDRFVHQLVAAGLVEIVAAGSVESKDEPVEALPSSPRT
jgi:Coenzyme PQQ synthesis protein D (PqqD)